MSKPQRPVYRARPRLAPELRVSGPPVVPPTHERVPVVRAVQLRADEGASVSDSGTLAGNPSVMGRAYPIGWGDFEVIFPGAFNRGGCLPEFVEQGFVAWMHDWRKMPLAMPTLAEERGAALYSEAEFYDHDDAQSARSYAAMRLAAGKPVNLSIGFYLDSEQYLWFESGENLLKYAEANSYPMALFDAPQIRACDDWILGVLSVPQLVEWSLVHRGANDAASLLETLSEEGDQEDDLPEGDDPPAEDVPDPGTARGYDPDIVNRANSLRASALLGATAPGETHG